MDIQTKDGILLRGIPDGTPDEVIKARIAKIRAEGGGKPVEVAPKGARLENAEFSATGKFTPSGEKPIALAGIAAPELPMSDFATGASGLMRGLLNLPGKAMDAVRGKTLSDVVAPNAKKEGLGDRAFPKSTNEGAAKFVGELADPLAWTIGGGVMKALPYAKVGGQGVVEAIKALAKNATGGAITGGTIGALSEEGDAATGAGIGAAANVVLPPALSLAGKGAGKVYDALTGQMAKIKAGDVLRQAAGNDLPAVRAAYAAAGPGETASQATAGLKRDTLDALGKFASTADETSHFSRKARNDAATRDALLEMIKPDLKASEKARSAATDPLYKAARGAGNVVDTTKISAKIDDLVDKNPGNPELLRELNRIKDGLKDDKGNLRINAQEVSSVVDGLKASIANKENKFIAGNLKELKDDISKAIPGFSAADSAFASASKPVNQSQVIEAMLGVLQKPGGGERVAPFLNVLGTGEQALLKKSTGYPRYAAGDLPKVLTGSQMNAVDRVASELTRDLSVEQGANRGGQALRGIFDKNIPTFKLFNVLDPRVALMNRVLGEGEIRIGEAMKRNLIEGMKSGKSAEELINALPLSERNKVVKALVDVQGKTAKYATRAATIGAAQQGEQ